MVIDSDLPAVENMTFETIQKVKKLVMIISERVPFEPKMSELWTQLATNNELGLRMLYALDKAQILALLTSKAKNGRSSESHTSMLVDGRVVMDEGKANYISPIRSSWEIRT